MEVMYDSPYRYLFHPLLTSVLKHNNEMCIRDRPEYSFQFLKFQKFLTSGPKQWVKIWIKLQKFMWNIKFKKI